MDEGRFIGIQITALTAQVISKTPSKSKAKQIFSYFRSLPDDYLGIFTVSSKASRTFETETGRLRCPFEIRLAAGRTLKSAQIPNPLVALDDVGHRLCSRDGQMAVNKPRESAKRDIRPADRIPSRKSVH
jgi:hypothetical protein